MTARKKVDKDKAVELRIAGKSYKEIAEELNCSVGWCEKNLVGIKPVSHEKFSQIVEEVRKRGRTPTGVTSGEIKGLVIQSMPKPDAGNLEEDERQALYDQWRKDVDEEVQRVKASAKRKNPDVIIRPYWMVPDRAQDSINTIHDMTQKVYELLHDQAREYRKKYDLDESYHDSVVYELSRLSAPHNSALLPEGFFARGDRLAKMAETLAERNEVSEPENQWPEPRATDIESVLVTPLTKPSIVHLYAYA